MFTEGRHTAEFLLSEANGVLSRVGGIIAQGPNLLASGTVMSLIDGKYIPTTIDTEASAVLYARIDPTAGDVKAVLIVRSAELIGDALTFGPDIATIDQRATKYAELARSSLIVR